MTTRNPMPLTNSLAKAALVLGTALMLTSCSSVKTQVDRGQVRARTFSFLDTESRTVPTYAEDRQAAHTIIQQAIINNLAQKGVKQVSNGGDLTVAYLVVVGNNVTTTSLNRYFGYGSDADAWVNRVHKQQTEQNTSRNYFEAGTLVVDLLDPATSKVLQRRSIQAQVLRDLPLETRAARVQAIVDQALADVRIAH